MAHSAGSRGTNQCSAAGGGTAGGHGEPRRDLPAGRGTVLRRELAAGLARRTGSGSTALPRSTVTDDMVMLGYWSIGHGLIKSVVAVEDVGISILPVC